ncbi:DNA polymerase III, delta prime subunit [Halobacillus karajensis]|uniref:DNA polymerase III subunit gamma/tau n=1 Tax=Halobacillus karajensis TaxID=195088 RepID=A0A024P9K3_9BACI|nr:DNA polymerase III subunit delta' [Halobacillus karajensis]CDQ21758.1 DNA polymerase III subunit gamma/tau [Halobacillus karajensis]CDQ25754.1 DNA polymerase III subunit gamma/tau [Halobacillus karajensis]CDQ29755.1 DNA polymerase III subunit gamma/tau [Halobacillus karajensis]SEI12605.1 DNA polymerase III, delta prime subunit [Halobacillus karajensis]
MQTWTQMKDIQPLAAQMLVNSFKKDRISHAYLFQGNRGTGKKEMSTLFAKSIFCKHRDGEEPCQNCRDCHRIDSGNHPDLHWIEPDGQSIKKEQILHLQKEFTYTGLESNRKVYIIVDADKMTVNASNRLLKFLEEPSQQTTAMLLTESGPTILDTIRSRCQLLAFQPLNPARVQEKLAEAGVSESSARLLSSLTNNLTEALEMNEDEWFANVRKLVIQLIEVLQNKPNEGLLFINYQWMPHFKDRTQLQRGLDVLMLWFQDVINLLLDREETIVFTTEREKLNQASMRWSRQSAARSLTDILEAKRKINQNVHPNLVMEQLTLQLQR